MMTRLVFCIWLLHCTYGSFHGGDAVRHLPMPRGSCVNTAGTLTCDHIPRVVPAGVRNVIISKHSGDLPNDTFTDRSWGHVESLHFTGSDFSDIHDFRFARLSSATEILLNFPDARRFSRRSLFGLHRVTKMIMINMSGMDAFSLEKAFSDPRTLPNLVEFTFNPGVDLNSPAWVLSDNFSEAIFHRPIRLLNFSNTIIFGKKGTGLLLLLKLDVLNISGAVVIPDPETNVKSLSTMSESSLSSEVVSSFLHGVDTRHSPLLYTLDCSSIKVPYGESSGQHLAKLLWHMDNNLKRLNPMFMKIVNLHANNVQHVDLDFTDSADFRNYDVFLKRLYVRNNNVVKFNSSVVFSDSNSIELVDASENKLEYINPKVFSTTVNLRYLYLAYNRLHEMESLPDMAVLFKTLKNVLELDLRGNNLACLPWGMFHFNSKLQLLNLAENRMATITFDLRPLQDLQTLDLSHNTIRSIDGAILASLSSYVNGRETGGGLVSIDLRGNPLACKCGTQRFIKWLAQVSSSNVHARLLVAKCSYEGSLIDINQTAAKQCWFLCQKTLIVSLSASLSVLALAIVSGTILVCRRLKKRRNLLNKQNRFKVQFLSRNLPQRFLVFLAHSSADEDIVNYVICRQIQGSLQQRLGTCEPVVCAGTDFRPGFSIMEETFRLVKASSVFVAIVSNAFCRSVYCRAEIREACNQNKPIILILLEEINEEEMSPYLLEIFKRYSRAKLLHHDQDASEFVPSLDLICDSILQLAINSLDL